ncbi:alpha/beta fold hydrolase [Nocardioides sp. YIM 152315]|uniref:alpha/beta fold hydrolase n=1 Tax=Nocardioides sp. YIM 152315 TaxID=3031760 RepID=UPI0023DC779E|nr:alpha/beta fold hydrolase [Nocardioides sp. YIM 152315]MDF1604110.1 alpha/beta fold hydrolase [Nocardioides sp. YIM 152315]
MSATTSAPSGPELTHDGTLRELPTTDGVLRYHEAGDPAAPPLLLLHGSGPGVTGWRNFGENLPLLAQHFRCLVLEFPGFGVSDATDQHPMAAALPAVDRFLDGLRLDRVDVIGNSMGGVVATRFAVAQPERVRRMVTVGGMGRAIFSPSPGEGLNLLMEFTEAPSRERLVEWLNSMVHDRSLVTEELIEQRWAQAIEPSTLAAARRMYSRPALEGMSRAAESSPEPPYWAMLHRIRARTLLTWGRDDRVSPLDMALVPMRTIPDVELHVLPNCGHWAMIEQKSAWEAVVLAFLTRED